MMKIVMLVVITIVLALLPAPSSSLYAIDPVVLILLVIPSFCFEKPLPLSLCWGVGLVMDVLKAGLLGGESVAIVITVLASSKLLREARHYAVWQLIIAIGSLTLLHQLSVALIYALQGFFTNFMILVTPVIMNMFYCTVFSVLALVINRNEIVSRI